MEPAVNRKQVISGIGLLTALGESAGATWEALLAGRGIVDHARVPGFSGAHRAVAMAERAGAEAMAGAGWTKRERESDQTGIFVGTSKGAIEGWMDGQKALTPALSRDTGRGRKRGMAWESACEPAWGLAEIDGEIARRLGFGGGPRVTISSACSSGLHALVRAAMAIESGEICRAIVVGVEASVHPLFISSFRRLGVLAPEGHGCRPFDRERSGFVISEAAAAVCVESIGNTVGRPMVRIARWAVGGDGTHLTGGDPEGKALGRLIGRVARRDCDLVHAHATGTVVNDPIELAAILGAVGEDRGRAGPWLYSHKGALGHSLGAAGMVSVVLNCLSHERGCVPGNVRSGKAMEMGGLRFSTGVVETAVRRSIAVAAGFGGPLAVVGLESF